ncbi:Lrp/AsnC family transcriptional regulator [Paenibacillus pasadenensis]|uniref:Transcriptional regulator, AsnC family n=1 Tax=Paenibacillus pasadenensis TaxID=217090 RepID=A0A2N5ND33_9BACL|nr:MULTISPECIES: Lrp/AsnC family transcriptional regulator [Paenibacillus]PLT48254.1 Transcriptional regulator, AsnC family [Paenibacillus pasadenensis]QGG58243.1 AsnC family transcriptional regulator [Paenibacillus sp. B01]
MSSPPERPRYPIPATRLDEIDRRILELLRANSRMSYTDISKEVGISRVGVQARVNALSESGVIERFTLTLRPDKIGLGASAFFLVEVEPPRLHEAAERLAAEPQVTEVCRLTGPSALHVRALFADLDEMDVFLQDRLYPIAGVVRVDSQLLSKRYKY